MEVSVVKLDTNSLNRNPKKGLPSQLFREDFDGGPVSLDEIVTGLYLGNLTAATHMETLKLHKITHILTLDSVPLPAHIVDASFLTWKFIHVSDMPNEDILNRLDECIDFIESALAKHENILVHCYFGVSRSSSVVIAYVMKKHVIEYEQAFELVKTKRRFVQPNWGFVSQLKLYKQMGCKIDHQCQKYKIYRLRLSADKVRKAKILPQSCMDIIKFDPGLVRENPEPIVYRCRKCRRIVASKSNVLSHTFHSPNLNKNVIADLNKATADDIIRNTQYLSIENKISDSSDNICNRILFVEPIEWMKDVLNNTQGRLNCPKCTTKLGNFSWINGCQCPCGINIAPAFYLVPSKIELSKAVQNIQTTI